MFPRCSAILFLVSCTLMPVPCPAAAASPEQRFTQLDADGSGGVTWEEFSNALPGMTSAAFSMIDKDSSGTISLEEWKGFSAGHGGKAPSGSMPPGKMPPPGMMKEMMKGMGMPAHDGGAPAAMPGGNAGGMDAMPLVMPPAQDKRQ